MAKKTRSQRAKERFLPESAQAHLAPGEAGEDQPFTGTDNTLNDRRIANVGEARNLYTRLFLEAQLRVQSWAQIRNQIEGGRPFDPGELIRAGEAWRSNVNFQDARSAFKRASLPYWKMVNEVPRKASVTLHSKSPHASIWALAMAEAYDMFCDDWGSDYYMQFSGFCDDFVMFGPGYLMWPDPKTPRYKWAQTVQMLFPKRTRSNIDEWELVCLRREITGSELLEHIGSDVKHSETAGWNPEAVKQAIMLAAPGPQQTRYLDPNYWQDMVVNNDLVIGGVWPPIAVVDLWAKSKDGNSIRHYIFTESGNVMAYLYEADEEAKSFRQLFGAAFYGVGSNGLIHSIKGFGVINYYYATAINRTKCRMLDSSTFAMGMNFTKEDNTPDGTPPVENVSMLNIFPTGLKQMQWFPNLEVGIALVESLKKSQDENNFQYNEIKDTIADTDTATQAKLVAGIGAEMGTASSSIFLSQYGHNVLTEQFNRLCDVSNDHEDCVKFRNRCQALGVPKEAFAIERTVKTGASPMLADPTQRQQAIIAGRQLMYNLPNANRRWWDEMTIADMFGASAVDKALLPDGAESDPAARRLAMMEDANLSQGMPIPVAPEDAHVEHVETHLNALAPIMKAVQAGQQPTPEQMVFLQMALPHVQQHLAFLSQDETKKPQYQALNAGFMKIASFYKGLATRLAKAHQTNPGDASAVQGAMQSQS